MHCDKLGKINRLESPLDCKVILLMVIGSFYSYLKNGRAFSKCHVCARVCCKHRFLLGAGVNDASPTISAHYPLFVLTWKWFLRRTIGFIGDSYCAWIKYRSEEIFPNQDGECGHTKYDRTICLSSPRAKGCDCASYDSLVNWVASRVTTIKLILIRGRLLKRSRLKDINALQYVL